MKKEFDLPEFCKFLFENNVCNGDCSVCAIDRLMLDYKEDQLEFLCQIECSEDLFKN